MESHLPSDGKTDADHGDYEEIEPHDCADQIHESFQAHSLDRLLGEIIKTTVNDGNCPGSFPNYSRESKNSAMASVIRSTFLSTASVPSSEI